MADAPALSLLNELPSDATNAEALAWVARIRRVVDRWETLPGYADRCMTLESRQLAYNQLADLEQSIERNMQVPESA